MQLLCSPIYPAFDNFLDRLQTSCIICSPYITARPVERLLSTLHKKGLTDSIALRIVTDISAATVLDGATDVPALAATLQAVVKAEIYYVPRVHAKVYVANEDLAVIGSFNCTEGGLFNNLEYGIVVRDRDAVRTITADLERYSSLGGIVTQESLSRIRARVDELRAAVQRSRESLDPELVKLTSQITLAAEDELIRVRVLGRTINAIFADTIVYLLRQRSMTTEELHGRVREIHPDLCDDTVDRVIDGKRFGKLWKHQVRNAQQFLQRRGQVRLDPGTKRWVLVVSAATPA